MKTQRDSNGFISNTCKLGVLWWQFYILALSHIIDLHRVGGGLAQWWEHLPSTNVAMSK